MQLRLLFLVLAVGIGCASRPDNPTTPQLCATAAAHKGNLVLTETSELTAAARCQVIEGNLVVRGAEIRTLAPLSRVHKVTGDLIVSSAFALDAVSGLDSLREVGGNFVVAANPVATGVFFGALERVGGDVRVSGNGAALTVSLHRLTRIGGSSRIDRNDSLLRLDLSKLQQVVGNLAVTGNPRLERLAAPQLRQVGGSVSIDPAQLPKAEYEALRRRLQSPTTP